MSYLYRTGNGRNNIAWTTTSNSSTKYLRRTATGRNNIVWTTIPSGSTYNILQRNSTGRNNILWANLKIGDPGDPQYSTDITAGDYYNYNEIYYKPFCLRPGFGATNSWLFDINGTDPRYGYRNTIEYSALSDASRERFKAGVGPMRKSTWDMTHIVSEAHKITFKVSNGDWFTYKINSFTGDTVHTDTSSYGSGPGISTASDLIRTSWGGTGVVSRLVEYIEDAKIEFWFNKTY